MVHWERACISILYHAIENTVDNTMRHMVGWMPIPSNIQQLSSFLLGLVFFLYGIWSICLLRSHRNDDGTVWHWKITCTLHILLWVTCLGAYQGQNLALLFCSSINYAALLSYHSIWSASYGSHVHYWWVQIRHFIITNCNVSFSLSLP